MKRKAYRGVYTSATLSRSDKVWDNQFWRELTDFSILSPNKYGDLEVSIGVPGFKSVSKREAWEFVQSLNGIAGPHWRWGWKAPHYLERINEAGVAIWRVEWPFSVEEQSRRANKNGYFHDMPKGTPKARRLKLKREIQVLYPL